uniref:N-acetyltransferase domain-containing protein n=1 Tax=Anolis carolinensis TaxID=28377 RepID=A0A803SSY3_ANOCA
FGSVLVSSGSGFLQPTHPISGVSLCFQIGLEKGCTQMKFSVLDWNRPAIDFYLGEGAVDLTAAEGWHVFRFEADTMRQLANK